MLKELLSVLLICNTAEAVISVRLTSPARYLISNGATGRVYVSTGPTVYTLSQDLQQLDAIIVGANQNEMSGMALTDNGNWLVICLKNSSCSVFDARSALSASFYKSVKNAIAGSDGAVVFTDSNNTFYTGGVRNAVDSGCVLRSRHVFAQFGFAGSTVGRLNEDFSATGSRVMHGGFYDSPYAYYVSLDQGDQIRVIRVCDENATETSNFSAVYELELECGDVSVDRLAGVSLVNSSTIVLGVVDLRSSDLALNLSGRARSAVCSYNLDAINAAMDRFFNDCLVQRESYSNNVDIYSGEEYNSPCSSYNEPVSTATANACMQVKLTKF